MQYPSYLKVHPNRSANWFASWKVWLALSKIFCSWNFLALHHKVYSSIDRLNFLTNQDSPQLNLHFRVFACIGWDRYEVKKKRDTLWTVFSWIGLFDLLWSLGRIAALSWALAMIWNCVISETFCWKLVAWYGVNQEQYGFLDWLFLCAYSWLRRQLEDSPSTYWNKTHPK